MKLIIVESPAKIKTIEKFLTNDYKVVSSKGHIRDLATSGFEGLGIDVENDYIPKYKNVAGKTKLINEIKNLAKSADKVYLATDPDREGESIAWHLAQVLELPLDENNRISFNEITKQAVLESLKNEHKIDINRFDAQESRRIIDRIIGFRLSKFIRQKIRSQSAGRVQSVALFLIVERERQIQKFQPEEYWEVNLTDSKNDIKFKLEKYQNKKLKIENEKQKNKILESLDEKMIISRIKKQNSFKNSPVPLITSTLQLEAFNKFGYSAKKTMMIAQKLYEGISIKGKSEGLITYMRTDSMRLNENFVTQIRNKIIEKYTKGNLGSFKNIKQKGKIQDAHEAIRMTNINYEPDLIKQYLTSEQYKIYNLIYTKTMATQMKKALVEKVKVTIENNKYEFNTNGTKIINPGYLMVYNDSKKDVILPEKYEEGFVINPYELLDEQKFTKPPARYTEAQMIKKMEELAIGRPSTYATIADTLSKRNYIVIEEKKMKPTNEGVETNDILQKYFQDIINVEYTAQMEKDLDEIETHQIDKVKIIDSFYKILDDKLKIAFDKEPKKPLELVNRKCPICDNELVIRKSKFGSFVGCSDYPKCKYVEFEKKTTNVVCSKCKTGNLIEKKTRKGKIFYACENYPKCDQAYWNKPTNQLCENCGANLTIKGKITSCEKCKKEKNGTKG